jgi:hypothetical protein
MLKTLLLTMVAVLGMAAATQADSAFDGTWNANVVRPAPAGPQTLKITLNTMEGKVTGSMVIQDVPAPAPITWGMVKGDLITFKVTMPFGTTNAVFVYLGKMENGQINFGRRPEDLTQGRLVEFMATKGN